MFSEQQVKRIEELKAHYQHPKSVILEALWMWQDEHGWVSEEGMKAVAEVLGVPYHHVYGVVTFYTMYNRAPVGKQAPPLPRSPDFFTSSVTSSGFIESALRSI